MALGLSSRLRTAARASGASPLHCVPGGLAASWIPCVRMGSPLRAPRFEQLRTSGMQARCTTADTSEVADQPAAPAEPPVSALDIRVGRIVKCEKHPDADSLYVEEIDIGEEQPRTIVSGLAKYVPLDQMQDRPVVILANLKARNMRGIKSNGMVLCACDSAHETVEPIRPPGDAVAGERVWFGDDKEQGAPETPNRIDKKKMWDVLQPHLMTNGSKVASFKGKPMLTSAGPVTADSLTQSSIS